MYTNIFMIVFMLIKVAYEVVSEVLEVTGRFWVIMAQVLIVIMIVIAFIPNLSWSESLINVGAFAITNPATDIFYYFNDAIKSLKETDIDNLNGVLVTWHFLLYVACHILALGMPLLFLFGWMVAILFGFIGFIPQHMRFGVVEAMLGDSSRLSNDFHLLFTNHTSIQDTFDADVQANAIADAIKDRTQNK